jgi:predicted RecB family nuclease
LHFNATDVFTYYKPSRCARRVALEAAGVEPQPTDTDFLRLLRSLGEQHEKTHLLSLAGVLDLAGRDPGERERRTLEAIRSDVPAVAIYQPRFRAEVDLSGETCELVGEPDFLVRSSDGAGYVIRDSKLARNVLSDRHSGIRAQLQIYGLLYERVTGQPPVALEVHAGTGELVPIPYPGASGVIEELRRHREMRLAGLDAYEPTGWTKCAGCGYEDRCKAEARAASDVALLPPVGQALARTLHERGIASIGQLQQALDGEILRDLLYDKGTKKREPRPKKLLQRLRRSVQAHAAGAPVPIDPQPLPDGRDCVMLDLEGLPAYVDDLEKVYLWGLKDFVATPPRFLPALSGFGEHGDREGWEQFLRTAADLLEKRPGLRLVHWGSYERTKVERYIERHGDSGGVAARVVERLLDLHPILTASVALPVESYGLKSVEKKVGFARKLEEADGQWAIAEYIKAAELAEGENGDPPNREEILAGILAYNEEDLDATWAVMEWLRRLPRS